MPRIREDPTIHVGLRLYDGTDYDTVIERVEYGGFGVIAFGPNRLRDNRMTAYKTLRRELLDDPTTRANFVRECLLWVGLWPHPNVEAAQYVLEMGDAINQRLFLALEYAEYGSLRELLRGARKQPGGRIPFAAALHLAQQIAAGLAYLHQPDPAYLRPVPTVHRDLKPENVLLMQDGRAVITDFGLAKVVERSPTALALVLGEDTANQPRQAGHLAEEAILLVDAEATQTTSVRTLNGIAVGTPPYMAPEQWEDARYAGTSADIYAFGVMLSEILVGRHPLLDLDQSHSLAEWRHVHRDPHPRPLREVAPEIPASIETIYQGCLARDPEERPTADVVLAALRAGARDAGTEVYAPYEMTPHVPYNELIYWHRQSIAYDSFLRFEEALTCAERALPLAQSIRGEEPGLLPAVLMELGNILTGLGDQARAQGKESDAAAYDQRAEAAYQESLMTRPPVTTPEGSRGRAHVWHQIGIFNARHDRYAHAEDAYGRALKLQPNMSDTYFMRASNQQKWGIAELRAGRREAGIEHLRQARVFAITSLGLGDPTAQRLLDTIEDALRRSGAAD